MGLPTNQDLRAAYTALGQAARDAAYYSNQGSGQFTDAERQAMSDAMSLLSRGNITPLEVLNRSTALPSTPFFTAVRQGVYLCVGYFILVTPATAGTATFGLNWNDGVMAQSENQLVNVGLLAPGQRSFVKALVLGAGQGISANLAINGLTGAPVYSIYARILEL